MTSNEQQKCDRKSSIAIKRQQKNQLPMGIALLALLFVFGICLATISTNLAIYWTTGVAFGFVLQKSRFCFTASIRDPYLTGDTSLTKAVLLTLAITTIGFTAIKYAAFRSGQPIPGQEYINPISLATAIGGILFGIGMVIASGCASGMLMRIGEGFQTLIVTLVFFVIGSFWGAHDIGWWSQHFVFISEGIFLPDLFGWSRALILQLLIIALLYRLADKWKDRDSD